MIFSLHNADTGKTVTMHPMHVAGITQTDLPGMTDNEGDDVLALVIMADGSQFVASTNYRQAIKRWQKALRQWLPPASAGE